MESKLVLIPHVTIHPDRICVYREVNWLNGHSSSKIKFDAESENESINESFLKSKRKNNGFLSDHAKRKLFRAIDYLLVTSDRKKVYSKVQKKYVSFQIVFVTLTLQAAQQHTDKEITNKCFNQLLIELSKYHNVKKYVWRAEKQENGNIHYHLLINEFIEWSELRKRWNRICNKLDYVNRYQAKMQKMYKNGFKPTQDPNDKRTICQQRKAYIIGQKSNWTSPNSTDIHDTRKVRNIKKYVGKYMTKQPNVNVDELSDDSNVPIVEGRLWSCSQNLSNVKGCQLTEDWEISDEITKIVERSQCYVYSSIYFQVVCISIQDIAKYGSELLFHYFSDYLIEHFGYNLQRKIAA